MNTIAMSRAPLAGVGEDTRTWIVQEIRENPLIYGLLAVFFAYTVGMSILLGNSLFPYLYVFAHRATRAVVILCCAAFVILALRSFIQSEFDSPLRYIRVRLLTPANKRLLARYVFGLAVMTVFMASFLFNKQMIPVIEPFSWDPVLARWDLALFGGTHPWVLLQPWLSLPLVTILIDFLYGMWVPLVFVVWAGTLISPRVQADTRKQFWLATILSWLVIGLGMATALSSAGPCFAPALFPELADDYAGLNAYLASVNDGFFLASSAVKVHLWNIHTGIKEGAGGISAMPSMHNAQAVLFVLVGYAMSRRIGHLMLAYSVTIFIGSIHLAWHYAVDGLIGGAAAIVLWWLAGVAVRRRSRPPLAVPAE